MNNNDIDFVLLWVDNEDPKWKKDFEYCSRKESAGDKRTVRYRDWDNLHYWFRSIEKFAPWVNKIHLVTYGHIPDWLNTKNPKINIVNHSDIFLEESKSLPTFNSRAIEVNLHRIPGLSERFVYFNDDTFLLKSVDKNRFFHHGKPVDIAVMNVVSAINDLSHVLINNLKVLNRYYTKKTVLRNNFFGWFNFKYGFNLFRTLCLLSWPNLTGFYDPHQPVSYLKRTFVELWEKEEEILLATSYSKFKNNNNVNQYLFRYWQLLKSDFYPNGLNDAIMLQLYNLDVSKFASDIIVNQKYNLLCLNDTDRLKDFDLAKEIINNAFSKLLPSKCSFEK